MNVNFLELISEESSATLKKEGIQYPTDIQAKAIPLIKSGIDVAACSPTGTGKTLAYLLPLLEKIDCSIKTPQAIIIVPTRELAAQVFKQAKLYSAKDIKPALMIGGADLKRQLERLKEKPQIIIGSVGRILELIKMKKLSAHTVKTIVIDEADRMLDENNILQVQALVKTTQRDRQLLFFSASIDSKALAQIKSMAKELQFISVEKKLKVPENIDHAFFLCEQREKIKILRKILSALNISQALVFLNDQEQIENMTKRLNYHGIKTAALFGEAHKKERKKALEDFLENRVTLLIASDLAARGLDIKGLEYIINMDMPEDPIFYLHRAGRCGRLGAQGMSVIIAEQREIMSIKRCEKKLKIKITHKDIRYGQLEDQS